MISRASVDSAAPANAASRSEERPAGQIRRVDGLAPGELTRPGELIGPGELTALFTIPILRRFPA